jgi:hypothetical protein
MTMAGTILLLVVFIAAMAVMCFCFTQAKHVLEEEVLQAQVRSEQSWCGGRVHVGTGGWVGYRQE